jgi:hypothetical protein
MHTILSEHNLIKLASLTSFLSISFIVLYHNLIKTSMIWATKVIIWTDKVMGDI